MGTIHHSHDWVTWGVLWCHFVIHQHNYAHRVWMVLLMLPVPVTSMIFTCVSACFSYVNQWASKCSSSRGAKIFLYRKKHPIKVLAKELSNTTSYPDLDWGKLKLLKCPVLRGCFASREYFICSLFLRIPRGKHNPSCAQQFDLHVLFRQHVK